LQTHSQTDSEVSGKKGNLNQRGSQSENRGIAAQTMAKTERGKSVNSSSN